MTQVILSYESMLVSIHEWIKSSEAPIRTRLLRDVEAYVHWYSRNSTLLLFVIKKSLGKKNNAGIN